MGSYMEESKKHSQIYFMCSVEHDLMYVCVLFFFRKGMRKLRLETQSMAGTTSECIFLFVVTFLFSLGFPVSATCGHTLSVILLYCL
jgi:ABC-type transport system involved in cytochrome c biogenesis permease component